MGSVWELDLPAPKLLILLALADHADHNGDNVYPSIRLVGWKTGYSERQCQRIMRALIKDGILQVVERAPGKTTKYRIDVSSGVKKSPIEKTSNDVRQNVTPDIAMSYARNVTPDKMSPLPVTSDVTPTPDITMSPKPSIKPSIEPSEKEKEVSLVEGYTKEQLLAITDPEEQKRVGKLVFDGLVEKKHPVERGPYTDAEIQDQITRLMAKYGKKSS